jgi:hypothetical protein
MSIASIKAGKAFYEILAEDKTAKGLGSAEAALMRFGAKIGTIGASLAAVAATGLTGLGTLVKGFAGAGDDLLDASAVTGMSTDFLQSLKFAAADAGVEFGALQQAIGKYSSLITDAAAGSASAQATLAKLGLTAGQLSGLSMDDQFKLVADAIARIPDPAARAAAAMDVFGKSGAKLLPVLAGGAKELSEALADMKSRGLILSEKDIALAAEANGKFLLLGQTFSHVLNLIGAAAAPVLMPFLDMLQSGAELVARFVNNNRWLVAGFTTLLGIVGAVGVALMALGGVASAIALASSGFLLLKAAIGTTFAFLASPIFIVVAAITACGIAAGIAAYQLDQVFNAGQGLKFIADMAQSAADSIGAIANALLAGEWGLAGEFIATSIEHAFDGMILTVKAAWADLMTYILSSLPANAFTDAMMQDINAGVGDDMAAFVDSTQRLTELRKRIASLPDPLSNIFGKGGKRSALGMVADSNDVMQTMGALSSSAAARFDNSAPVNGWQDKMLKTAEDHLNVAKETREAVLDLQPLAVE